MKNALMLTPKDIVQQKKASIMQALYGQTEEDKKRFMHAVLGVVSQPMIMDCDTDSVLSCVYGCARLSLAPDPVLQLAAIVPYNDTKKGIKRATLQIMYKGYIELARRAAPDLSLNVGTVYEGDEFVLIEGLEPKFSIRQRWWMKYQDPGEPLFSYCITRQTNDSVPQLTIVSRVEAKGIAEKSKAGIRPGTPWHDHFVAMMEKTAVRKSAKLWKLDPNKPAAQIMREAEQIEDGYMDVMDAVKDVGNSALPEQQVPELESGDQGKAPPVSKTDLLMPHVKQMIWDFYGEEVGFDEGQWERILDATLAHLGVKDKKKITGKLADQFVPLIASMEPDDIERIVNGAKDKGAGD